MSTENLCLAKIILSINHIEINFVDNAPSITIIDLEFVHYNEHGGAANVLFCGE